MSVPEFVPEIVAFYIHPILQLQVKIYCNAPIPLPIRAWDRHGLPVFGDLLDGADISIRDAKLPDWVR